MQLLLPKHAAYCFGQRPWMSAKNLEMSCESPPPQLPDPWPEANSTDDDQLPEPEPIDLLSPLPSIQLTNAIIKSEPLDGGSSC